MTVERFYESMWPGRQNVAKPEIELRPLTHQSDELPIALRNLACTSVAYEQV